MLALVAIAAVFVVLAVLYLLGTFNLFASQTGVHHVKHAVVLGALAVACLVGASFLRPRIA
jgi:uncharacterized membrane protein